MKYGYCTVGGPMLGLEGAEALHRRGSDVLEAPGMEKVEFPEVVGEVDTGLRAARFFRLAEIDALVMNVAGWMGGGAFLRFASEFPGVPLILWGFGKGASLTLVCLIEATSDLVKTGRRFLTVIGDPGDPATPEDLGQTLRGVDALVHAQKATIGLIGYAQPGMVDVCVDEISLRRKIGCDLVHMDLHEVILEYESIRDEDVAGIVRELTSGPAQICVDERELVKSCRTYVALKNVIQRNRLDAAAIRCWPELRDVPPRLHASPCLGVSRLADEGIVLACEDDVSAAVTMLIMRRIAGRPPVVLDYNTLDRSRNSLGFWHCGAHALSLAADATDIRVQPPANGGDGEWGGGCAVHFNIREGPSTLAKLTREYDKMSIASGTFVKPDRAKMGGGVGEAVMMVDAHDYLQRIIAEGFEHHVCAVHGDVTRELQTLCRLADIAPLIF